MKLSVRRAIATAVSSAPPPPRGAAPIPPIHLTEVPEYVEVHARLATMRSELEDLENQFELATTKRPDVRIEAEALAAGTPLPPIPASNINRSEAGRRISVLKHAIRLLEDSVGSGAIYTKACRDIRAANLPEQKAILDEVGALVPALSAALERLWRFNEKFEPIDHPPPFHVLDARNQDQLSRLCQQLAAWPEPLVNHDEAWKPPLAK